MGTTKIGLIAGLLTGLMATTAWAQRFVVIGGYGPYHRYYYYDDHAGLHDELEHNDYHRELEHRSAHRYPMSWWQHERLHDELDHDVFHDWLNHREFHRNYYPQRHYSVGGHGYYLRFGF